jgi:hypothetical protein
MENQERTDVVEVSSLDVFKESGRFMAMLMDCGFRFDTLAGRNFKALIGVVVGLAGFASLIS